MPKMSEPATTSSDVIAAPSRSTAFANVNTQKAVCAAYRADDERVVEQVHIVWLADQFLAALLHTIHGRFSQQLSVRLEDVRVAFDYTNITCTQTQRDKEAWSSARCGTGETYIAAAVLAAAPSRLRPQCACPPCHSWR